MASGPVLDTVVIGCGPGGLTAGMYAARYKLSHVVVGDEPGGTMLYADLVENYPGVPSIEGKVLMDAFKSQARNLDVHLVHDTVERIEASNGLFTVHARDHVFETRTIIMATGSERRKLGVPGEEEYAGSGVSYCATCDAAFFKNRVVCVVGGSDSAAKEALVLSRVARQVNVIYRKGRLRAEPVLADKVYACNNVHVMHDASIERIEGDGDVVSKIILDDGRELETSGVFIEVGFTPRSGLVASLGVSTNKAGEIMVDQAGKTSVPGVFAAGDVTNTSLKQAITAAGDGARACWSAFQHVQASQAGGACQAVNG